MAQVSFIDEFKTIPLYQVWTVLSKYKLMLVHLCRFVGNFQFFCGKKFFFHPRRKWFLKEWYCFRYFSSLKSTYIKQRKRKSLQKCRISFFACLRQIKKCLTKWIFKEKEILKRKKEELLLTVLHGLVPVLAASLRQVIMILYSKCVLQAAMKEYGELGWPGWAAQLVVLRLSLQQGLVAGRWSIFS